MKKRVQIFGLRCSGTNYLEQLVESNFPGVQITSHYGFKHLWNAQFKRIPQKEDNIYIIILIRNPFDWIRSVHNEPHHCPHLLGLPFNKFINSRWEAYSGEEWNSGNSSVRSNIIKDRKVFEDFEDVIDMRNKKLQVLMHLRKELSGKVHAIKYEDLYTDVSSNIKQISHFLEEDLSTDSIKDVSTYKRTDKKFKAKKKHKIDSSSLKEIMDRIDWSVEEYWGYQPSDYSYNSLVNNSYYKFKLRETLASLGIKKEEKSAASNHITTLKDEYSKLTEAQYEAKEKIALQVLEEEEKNEWALFQLGKICQKHLKDHTRALSFLQEITKTPHNAQRVNKLIIRSFIRLERYEEALALSSELEHSEENETLVKRIKKKLNKRG